MFSARVPPLRANRLAGELARLRSAGRRLDDLTESNPTQVGLPCPRDLLAPLASPDALAYDPAHRVASLERACDTWMFDLDLEERLCLPALEALAADSLSQGEAIPDEVLLRMGFPPDKLYRLLERNVAQQDARPEARAHLER